MRKRKGLDETTKRKKISIAFETLPAITCATPAKLKMLFLPMLCMQQPTNAASTVIDMIAKPSDRKKYEAFQQPGNTLESVAKPSKLKFAQ